MINVFVVRDNRSPVRRLLRAAPELRGILRIVCYDQLFARRATPAGQCVFTDFDLLSPFEIDIAARAATAAHAAGSRILNWPHRAAQRVELLRRLHALGLNPVEVTRVDEGLPPRRFPVFIRCEDGSAGPDTDILPDADAYAAAIAALRAQGATLKGRIAVSFEAAPDAEGFYRKYAAFVIGGEVVSHHILQGRGWNVKLASHVPTRAVIEEELAFVRDNPHADRLLRAAQVGEIDYCRIDYALRDGQVVIFEMNSNPHFSPRYPRSDPRAPRSDLVLGRIVAALRAVDGPGAERPVPFDLTETTGAKNPCVRQARWFDDLPDSLLDGGRWMRRFERLLLAAMPARSLPPN